MKINLKSFLLGMALAAGPVFLWSIKTIKPEALQTPLVLAASISSENTTPTNFTSLTSEYTLKENIEVLPPTQFVAQTFPLEFTEPSITTTSTPTPSPTDTPTPTQTKVPVVTPTVQQTKTEEPTPVKEIPVSNYDELITLYAAQYGADPTKMKVIAQCESGMRPEALNGSFGGMYQFLASTWSSNRNAMGENPDPALRFNAEEAIKTAAFKMGRDGYGAWPVCSKL